MGTKSKNCRDKSGSILVLTVCLMLVIVPLGLAIYYLTKVLGADRELAHAGDSGTLNIAKQAILSPNVSKSTIDALLSHGSSNLQAPYIATTVEALLHQQAGASSSVSDLLTYNRIVGQSLLVALNAQADGGKTALANAATMLQMVEGPTNSVGASLKQALSTNGSWVNSDFGTTAETFSTRMSGVNGSAELKHFAVAYVGQNPEDANSSNVQINGTYNGSSISIKNQLPSFDYQKGTQVELPASAIDSTGNYLSGYHSIDIPGVGSILGVPVAPDSQPHLVSLQSYAKSTKQPQGTKGAVAIPPNTFLTRSLVNDTHSAKNLVHDAAGIVASGPFAPNSFALSIPQGYLVIDNTGVDSYSAALPVGDNVTANQLASGISVDPSSLMFSNNGSLEAWMDYNASKNGSSSDNGGSVKPMPSLSGLYDSHGNPATAAEASKITGPLLTCNDNNSDTAESCPSCSKLLSSGAFDQAYFGGGSYGRATYVGNLTADEYTAVVVAGAYASAFQSLNFSNNYGTNIGGGWKNGDANSVGPAYVNVIANKTGLRLYDPENNPMLGVPTPWGPSWGPGALPGTIATFCQDHYPGANVYSDPQTFGKVSIDGTLRQLIEQNTRGVVTGTQLSFPGGNVDVDSKGSEGVSYTRNGAKQGNARGNAPVDELNNFITNRIYQIKPNASKKEIEDVLNTKIALGSMYFIYLDTNSGSVVCNVSRPAQVNAAGSNALIADGTPITFSTSFPLLGGLVNPPNYANVHEILFTREDGGSSESVHSITYTPGTGAYNNLGTVKFQNAAKVTCTFSGRN